MSRLARPRLLIAAAALLGLVACVVNLNFDIDRVINVDFTGSSLSQTVEVDLSTQPDIQAHKDNVQTLDLDSADAMVKSVGPSNNATRINGTLKLRAAGAPADGSHDVLVGTITNLPVTVGSSAHMAGSAALDNFLLTQLHGAGHFSAIIAGTTDGTVGSFVLDLKLHAAMGYQP